LLIARKEFARALCLLQQLVCSRAGSSKRIEVVWRVRVRGYHQTDGDNNGVSTSRALAVFQQAGSLHALGDSLAAAAALEKVDWELVRRDLPLVAADAAGIRSALGASPPSY